VGGSVSGGMEDTSKYNDISQGLPIERLVGQNCSTCRYHDESYAMSPCGGCVDFARWEGRTHVAFRTTPIDDMGEAWEQDDPVERPGHYTQGGIEVHDFIEAKGFADGFDAGNVLKYVSRYLHKNGTEDLKKARWYLDKLIERTESDPSLKS